MDTSGMIVKYPIDLSYPDSGYFLCEIQTAYETIPLVRQMWSRMDAAPRQQEPSGAMRQRGLSL
jgi:hypothetical protein